MRSAIDFSMRFALFTLVLLLFVSIPALSDPVPTTIDDFFMPGSQPLESGTFQSITNCDNCHGGYNTAYEPYFNWRGGMMSMAMKDPLFLATMSIANQDAPEAGDLCIRCHAPVGWLEGRSEPTNGSALTADDRESLQCHFCHKMVAPTPVGVNPYPADQYYTDNTYPRDQVYLSGLPNIPPGNANGMYVCDDINDKRGPYSDAEATHQMYYSPFHNDAKLCGTCHDVSNPAFTGSVETGYAPNSFGAPAPDFDLRAMLPVERTYSEWSVSDYNTAQGVYAPQFGGNADYVRTCQDCHMRDVTGEGCNKSWVMTRTNLGLHDLTGGNTWVGNLVDDVYPGESDPVAIAAAIDRTVYMLQNAASMELSVETTTSDHELYVTITNETGHKLPSGYPEGRRIWINVKGYNSSGSLIYESGAYDPATGILTQDSEAVVYQIKPGISPGLAPVVNLPEGPSFHFVLNDTIYKDNRIPPRGFTNAAFTEIQSPPVGHDYEDGQYWDEADYYLPLEATLAVVTLYYQTTSKEYMEFLRDENTTDNWGDTMYNLWTTNDRCPPVVMVADSITMEGPPPPLQWINVVPTGSTTIPVGGGFLSYNISAGNDDTNPIVLDIWVDVTVPGQSTPWGPVVGPILNFNMAANWSGNRDRDLFVDGSNPGGTYTLNGFLGDYNPPNNTIIAEDHFDFFKEGASDGTGSFWFVDTGESFEDLEATSTATPDDHLMVEAYPNPFNPEVAISIQQPAYSHLNLSVYDISGRKVVTLIDGYRDVGQHIVTFDGKDLPSGIYMYRLQSGNQQATGKLLLMK